MLRRAAGSVIASLLLWLAAVAGVSAAAPRIRSSLEVDAPSALVGRTICVERVSLTLGAPRFARGATHGRWSSGAVANTADQVTPHERVRVVLLEHARAHVPRTLRRTYDAHAPPRAIDRV
jgi:hypothetical protein